MSSRIFAPAFLILSLCAAPAAAQLFPQPELSPLGKAIRAAMDDERRSEAERARDANRKPIETLEFFRLRADMTVLELVPGGGWYTKLLGPVLAEEGKLYAAVGTQRVEALVGQPGFESLEVLPVEAELSRAEGSRRLGVAEFSFGVDDVDLALTFRNLHNFTPPARDILNRAVFDALVPGGLYGVIDHTRRHMEGDIPENWRRMDPVQMILEIEAAGFEFVGWSDLHFRPDDELRYEVGRKTVTGNTDRFTLLFRKPEA